MVKWSVQPGHFDNHIILDVLIFLPGSDRGFALACKPNHQELVHGWLMERWSVHGWLVVDDGFVVTKLMAIWIGCKCLNSDRSWAAHGCQVLGQELAVWYTNLWLRGKSQPFLDEFAY